MAQYNDTLQSLQGAVLRARNVGGSPGLDPSLINTFINFRMRQVIDARPYWSGLITRGILNIPNSQSVSSATMTQGSNQITAVGTTWPVSDVVNTVLNTAITNPGYQRANPASMNNITADTLLYVDAAGTNPEVVPVLEVFPGSFFATFQYTHAAGATVTVSSLAYQQFVVGFQYPPIYSITAVLNGTTLLLNQPWAGATLTSAATILQMLYTFAPDLKDFISVVDPDDGDELQLHYPLNQITWDDPQMSANDWPQYVVDHSANLNGNMQWLLWPKPTSQRQLYFFYIKQWADMRAGSDRPPSFVDPAILVYGALSDAWKVKLPGDDMRGNLQISQMWEQKFQQGLLACMQSDNGKSMQAYSWAKGGGNLPGGANFWQSHDPDAWSGNW